MEEKPKENTPSIDDLLKMIEDLKKEKDEKIQNLETALDEEKRKLASISITGLTKKVETKSEEMIDFDFDF